MDNAKRQPVSITKNGRPFVVVLSVESLENMYWGEKATGAFEKGEFMGEGESEKFLSEIMDAEPSN